MDRQSVEDLIHEALTAKAQENALDFVAFLRKNEMVFERIAGYWEDKLYWAVKFNDEYVCYLLIYSPNEEDGPWTIWTDDSNSDWYKDCLLVIDEQTKKIAWENVDICANCGSCSNKGTHKTIFGMEFDNVCGTTFKFVFPDAKTVECAKIMLEIRKNDILKIINT